MGTGSTDHTATVKKREAGLAPLWYAQRRVLRHALLIETSSGYHGGIGIALHARTLSLGMLHHDGEIMGHQYCTASPETFLQVTAP